ncbi:hypothetical protein SAMN05444280_11496 [Tangfeifania diversioriginum]|uniref:Uncharacterized protein n=1 Tax=Tangfeifania diversioriginum TaxID=1168035 RepID=A0A1M6HUV9_9BACT|nr:hypothetical protein SAMN05444280_11496 [Tangfeifania diversioriginum]
MTPALLKILISEKQKKKQILFGRNKKTAIFAVRNFDR